MSTNKLGKMKYPHLLRKVACLGFPIVSIVRSRITELYFSVCHSKLETDAQTISTELCLTMFIRLLLNDVFSKISAIYLQSIIYIYYPHNLSFSYYLLLNQCINYNIIIIMIFSVI